MISLCDTEREVGLGFSPQSSLWSYKGPETASFKKEEKGTMLINDGPKKEQNPDTCYTMEET